MKLNKEVVLEKILVSACLLGIDSKYNGDNNKNEKVLDLLNKYEVVPFCPEIMGGLSTPREPCEILGNKVITISGKDVTKNFIKGAKESLKLIKLYKIKKVVVKSKSPSCGYKKIYDGSFSNTLIEGNGITTDLLLKNNIEVLTEEDI